MELFSRRLLTTSHNVTVGNYKYWDEAEEIDLNAPYQRDYVWGEKEQQEFLFSLFNNLPLGTICIADRNTFKKGEANYEVVDGKQRITTLLMFLKDEIPYVCDGIPCFYSKMDERTQRQVRHRNMPYEELYHGVSEQDKLEYFFRVNFTGIPQSVTHKVKILGMIEQQKFWSNQ